ncbi:hypothetical protein BS47DRAFT_1339392, partial [Hydnum rufescens UP504]
MPPWPPRIMIPQLSPSQTQNYGAINEGQSMSFPVRRTSLSERSEDEDLDLEDYDSSLGVSHDLIAISYPRLLFNYAILPIFSIFILALFAAIPYIWAEPSSETPITSILRDVALGLVTWIASYTLRQPSFVLATCFGKYVTSYTTSLSTLLSVLVQESLRWFSIALLGVSLQAAPDASAPDWVPIQSPRDPAFQRIWWFAMGWACVGEIYGITQTYLQLALYKDLLNDNGDPDEEEEGIGSDERGSPSSNNEHRTVQSDGLRFVSSALKAASPPDRPHDPASSRGAVAPSSFGTLSRVDSPMSSYVDQEIAHLLLERTRSDLEEVWGAPPPNIPVFIAGLQRLDSLLLTFGLTLILSSRYLVALARNSKPSFPDASPGHCSCHFRNNAHILHARRSLHRVEFDVDGGTSDDGCAYRFVRGAARRSWTVLWWVGKLGCPNV